MKRRSAVRALAALAAPVGLAACGSGPDPPSAATRSWRMGFSNLPPRVTFDDVMRTIELWSKRGDLAAMHEEPPWAELLAGTSPDFILQRDKVGLADTYRGKGMQLLFMTDLTDGLDRSQEAPGLRALGRSLSEPAVQQALRGWVLGVSRVLKPEYLGLAAETNLIRSAAPSIYPAVRQTANDAAADLRAAGTNSLLFVSVQVEVAWGRPGNGVFAGIAADRADFAFMQMIGLSSYPYFGYAQPEDLPADYYSRLQSASAPLPMMLCEGGWPSQGVGSGPATIQSTPALQARYVPRIAALLDSVAARGWIQLTFTDIDLSGWPPPIPPNLLAFTTLGFVDTQYAAKPALAQWDALFARARA